jgi:hypothetical protein
MPITLSGTTATIAIGADVLQAGVDSTPPLITDHMKVPSTMTLVVTGSNTTENQHTYVKAATAEIRVINHQAQPLTVTVALPNTVWHPTSDKVDVTFAEKGMKITSSINILGGLTAVFECQPGPSLRLQPTIVHEGEAPSTTTLPPNSASTEGTTAAPATTAAPTGTTGSTSGTSGSLPRTGASWVLLLVLAAAAIDVGIVMIGATRRRFRHR